MSSKPLIEIFKIWEGFVITKNCTVECYNGSLGRKQLSTGEVITVTGVIGDDFHVRIGPSERFSLCKEEVVKIKVSPNPPATPRNRAIQLIELQLLMI